jgi:hypothetical protein
MCLCAGSFAERLFLRSLVVQNDPQPASQEGGLAQALNQCLRRVLDLFEDLGVGHESDRRAGVRSLSDDLYLACGDAARVLLAKQLAVAANFGHKPFRKRIDNRDANSVQPTRNLVSLAAELTSGV